MKFLLCSHELLYFFTSYAYSNLKIYMNTLNQTRKKIIVKNESTAAHKHTKRML